MPQTVSVFAPAKINLYLHLIKRKRDGYHKLDSLVAFADIGDEITIKPADQFSFEIDGPFAAKLTDTDKKAYIDSNNLVVKAARAISQINDKSLNVEITLTKNLPVAAGLGGGSSDAAATIWGLQQYWKMPNNASYLLPLMTNLGADVPVCHECRPAIMRGIGDEITFFGDLPEIPIVLINPMIACPTKDVFIHHKKPFKDEIEIPEIFSDASALISFLSRTDNDLYESAISIVPDIQNILATLDQHPSCVFHRMSGSGASCFGLFSSFEAAQEAKKSIKQENPDWWVAAGWLNRPERY